jgi:hypothetical protein
MEDVATEGADAPQGTTQDAPAGLDLSPVLERFDDMGSRMERIESQFSEYARGDEPEEADDEFDFASLFGDEQGQEAEPEPRNLNPEALQAFIAQQVERGIKDAVNPLSESVQGLTMRHEAAELVSRYPDMDKPEVAGPVIEEADQLAKSMGRPELATNMKFLGTIYEAQMARRYAAGEVPVGGKQGFEAERGGGAGPVASDAPDAAQQMIAQAQETQWWAKL